MTKTKCKECGKTLVPIADLRKNGTDRHRDWGTRQYHKKCWKERFKHCYRH